MEKITITKEALEIAALADKEIYGRPQGLNCLAISNSHAAAGCGKYMLRVEIDTDGANEANGEPCQYTITLTPDDCKLIKSLPEIKTNGKATFALKGNQLIGHGLTIDLANRQFPNIDKIFDDNAAKDRMSIDVNAKYLLKILRAVTKAHYGDNNYRLRLNIPKEANNPIHLEFTTLSGAKGDALLMPLAAV